MKIRNGFVTNSSSTSFILSMRNELTKKNFLDALGADGASPMNKIFEDLFNAIESEKKNIVDVARDYQKDLSVEEFLKKDGFGQDTVDIINMLLEEDRIVYYGTLSSDAETASEIYFCCQSFVICEEDIYFNGSIGGW